MKLSLPAAVTRHPAHPASPVRTIQFEAASTPAHPEFCDNAVTTAKYTLLDVLPKAIWNQFRRLSNFYFLIVAAVSFIPDISPSSPVTTTLPLVVVIGFGLARDVYEDILRHREDAIVNNKRYDTPRPPPNSSTRSRDIRVGQLVVVRDDQPVPCDLMLFSVGDQGDGASECFISTVELDGESNLKRRFTPFDTPPESFTVRVPRPAPSLYGFSGTLDNSTKLTDNHVLLRGSVLKNTPFITGLAIYTGRETKLSLNMALHTPSKLGAIERTMNAIVIALFVLLLIITFISAALAGVWQDPALWYLGSDAEISRVVVALRSVGTFIILYHTFVPVSLFVTLEFVRLVQGVFISADVGTGYAKVQANNLNETLGTVEHVFSDKTGTLTQNVMTFHSCLTPSGKLYSAGDLPECVSLDVADSLDEEQRLLLLMALTHDVLPVEDPRAPYQGESPDEVALVVAAAAHGARLTRRNRNNYTLNHDSEYVTHATVEFTSERKRMSVVVSRGGRFFVLTKGADSAVVPLLHSNDEQNAAQAAADQLSLTGLRTLVYAFAELSESDVQRYVEGNGDSADIETQLFLAGVTGIEDKLQENVVETLRFIRAAGLDVWVLTGDKLETARNIGFSSGLLTGDMELTTITGVSDGAKVGQLLQQHQRQQPQQQEDQERPLKADAAALLIDGAALAAILDDAELQATFKAFCAGVRTVVCCRVTPLQKASVVRLYKEQVTLAVGDGGNDVGMIQAASIGVGIRGREGSQASRAADYAVPEFQSLRSLLFVHGHLSYVRNGGVICMSLYKNVLFSATQFLFQFYCRASGTTLHNQWVVTSWNAILTLFPPFLYGIFETNLSKQVLRAVPAAYNARPHFGFRRVAIFLALAVLHSNIIFWLAYSTLGSALPDGAEAGFFFTGFAISSLALCVVLFKFFLVSHAASIAVLVGLIVSLALLVPLALMFTAVAHEYPLEGIVQRVLAAPTFLLLAPVTLVACFIPDFVMTTWPSAAPLADALRDFERRNAIK